MDCVDWHRTSWWPGSGAVDFATGAGDFAECFATWLVGSTSLSQVAGPCTDEDLATVRRMGCGIAQGYLIGRPAPAAAVLDGVLGVRA